MPKRRILARTPLDSLEREFAAIRRRENISIEYPPDVVDDAEAGSTVEATHVDTQRRDATDIPFVTIDPEGSRDLDQAVHIERREAGFRVFYAIADVGAHVVPGSALDLDTRERVETIYCPDRRVGLHPPVMSEGYASLLPGQRTAAVLWTLDVDRHGELVGTGVERAWVTSLHQYSYHQLATDPPPEAAELVRLMGEVGTARRNALKAKGAVTLPKPSQEVAIIDGAVVLEYRISRGIEDDNAQISLLTGMAAAALMLSAGVGILRTMPPATAGALARLRLQAKALKIEWPEGQSYADLLDRLDPDAPSTAAFLNAAVSLFRGARWEPFDQNRADALPLPDVTTHGALAAPYAHVTAPLRRLVDRYGTEICLAQAAGTPIPAWVLEALDWLGDAMVSGARRGKRVDQSCIDVVEAAVLAPHVGETFTGVGLDEDTVQLAQPAVVARCHGEVIAGREQSVVLVTADPRTGPVFTLRRPSEEPVNTRVPPGKRP